MLVAVAILAAFAGSALAAGNLVANGSFETDTDGDGIPDLWGDDPNFTPKDKRNCMQSVAGSCSFKMIADGNTKILIQSISLAGLQGDEFTFKAWTKGKDIVYGAGSMSVTVQINHLDSIGGTTFRNLVVPEGSSAWTLRQETFTADEDYDQIQVYIYVDGDSGKVWVDKVKLTQVAP